MKVIADMLQSGGAKISIVDDNGKVLKNQPVHLIPKKDGVLV